MYSEYSRGESVSPRRGDDKGQTRASFAAVSECVEDMLFDLGRDPVAALRFQPRLTRSSSGCCTRARCRRSADLLNATGALVKDKAELGRVEEVGHTKVMTLN